MANRRLDADFSRHAGNDEGVDAAVAEDDIERRALERGHRDLVEDRLARQRAELRDNLESGRVAKKPGPHVRNSARFLPRHRHAQLEYTGRLLGQGHVPHEEHAQTRGAGRIEELLDPRNKLLPLLYLANDPGLHVIDQQGSASGAARLGKTLRNLQAVCAFHGVTSRMITGGLTFALRDEDHHGPNCGASFPFVGRQIAILHGLGQLEQVLGISLQVTRLLDVLAGVIPDVLPVGPIRDRDELHDGAVPVPHRLHAEVACRRGNLPDAVFVEVLLVLLRSRGADAALPDAGHPGLSVRPSIRLAGSWCVGRLHVERLPVSDAAPDELRPGRDDGDGICLLRQQAPKRRVMPAKVVKAGIPMLPYTAAQLFHLFNELLAGHSVEVVVHWSSQSGLIFAAVTTRDQRASSLWSNAPNCSGAPPAGLMPCLASCSRISGCWSSVLMSAFSLAMTGDGVAAGTSAPCQVSI